MTTLVSVRGILAVQLTTIKVGPGSRVSSLHFFVFLLFLPFSSSLAAPPAGIQNDSDPKRSSACRFSACCHGSVQSDLLYPSLLKKTRAPSGRPPFAFSRSPLDSLLAGFLFFFLILDDLIFKEDGNQCRTSRDLDSAMLATRTFWFEAPVEWDEQWNHILDHYRSSDIWPDVPLPQTSDLLHTLLHTKDSAPGPDGLPYSAWRLLTEVTVDAMTSYFFDIMNDFFFPALPSEYETLSVNNWKYAKESNSLEQTCKK